MFKRQINVVQNDTVNVSPMGIATSKQVRILDARVQLLSNALRDHAKKDETRMGQIDDRVQANLDAVNRQRRATADHTRSIDMIARKLLHE